MNPLNLPLKILFPIVSLLFLFHCSNSSQILSGFSATPQNSLQSDFQPLLTDISGNFSLGFLKIQQFSLLLCIMHLPGSITEPIWSANSDHLARWSSTHLSFNDTLVLSDSRSSPIWSINGDGDRVVLLSTGNLQLLRESGNKESPFVVWQSFDHPTDTLMQGQNFTASMNLVSSLSITDTSKGKYSMRLNEDFLGLYADFHGNKEQLYWSRKATQEKARIKPGLGPIYARLEPRGFLAMYQTETSLVDVLAFESFQFEAGLRKLRLEPDGNLRGFYWNNSKWVIDFEAITDPCQLPSFCGPYGLCNNGGCSCLNNQTLYTPDWWCYTGQSEDLCNGSNGFRVLRREKVELPFKQLMDQGTVGSLEECEDSCERNCSCWGAMYNNISRVCYSVMYPVQTLVEVGSEGRFGYVKVGLERERGERNRVAEVVLLVVACVVLVGVGAFGVWSWWHRKKQAGFDGLLQEGLAPGSYRDLKAVSGSVELCNR
ncbi:hypothetical protein AMTRI_Chr11g150330 [Amborella trichopoda]